MKAIIISIGDELVLGQTIDTNSAWLSGQLASAGCDVAAHLTIADEQRAIETAVADSAARCDFLIISGGLGPTPDDLTRQALAAVLGQPLEPNAVWLTRLDQFFRQRGRPMPEMNKIQAMIPRGARMIDNSAGTAAGIDAVFVSGLPGTQRTCRIFAIPGVPREMKIMFQRDITPHVAAAASGRAVLSRTLHTFGLGESAVAQMLGDLMDRARNPSVGTTVSGGVVSLRVSARFPDRGQAEVELQDTLARCHAALGDLIYGEEEQTLAGAVGELLTPPLTLATAESCTGGLLAKMLTDVPGASRYFQCGWITYGNQAKTDLLDVDAELIAAQGAVSEGVVAAMAQAARQKSGASFALSISGIAGPEGGTPAKPVGTVCIGFAYPAKVIAKTFHFPGDREMIRDRSAKVALTLLRYHLLGKNIPF